MLLMRVMLVLTETALAGVALVVSLTAANLGSRWLERIESGFRNVGRRKTLSILIVGLAALAARAVVLPILPVPVPQVDDEFSHLLLADTLLHGRLANPTPPMWVHFETFEVNMLPTYASVYQPMQGIFLAAGRLLTGQPFFGVMLSVAVMCGAICWMLQGWMPAEWALLGGLLAVMRFGVFAYWDNSYWGGAPAAIGGALVLGALPRIKQNLRARDAVILGLGFSVLANSRPYEGFLLSLLVSAALLYWLFQRRGAALRDALTHFVLPLLIVVMIAAVATGYYFWRVTGNPLRAPYQVNWETYGMMPKFVWQSLRPKQAAVFRHAALIERDYAWEYATYASMRTFKGLLGEWAIRLVQNWIFYLGPILSLPLFAAAATAPYGFGWKQLDSNTRFLSLSAAIFAAGLAVEVFSFPHYAAPITCIILALVLLAMRELRSRQYHGKPFGLSLTRAIPALCLLILALQAGFAFAMHIPMTRSVLPSIYDAVREEIPRHSVELRLQEMPGQHLVIVHYSQGSEHWMGWVHNGADIDHSRIAWAWDMGAEKNRELLQYFSGRHAWLVNTGDDKPVAIPYFDKASR
jgi:hypothetical protein